MSFLALFLPINGGDPVLVSAKNLSDGDREHTYLCPSCRTELRLRGGEHVKLHFFGQHMLGCNIAHYQKTTLVFKSGYVVNLEAICEFVDPPYTPDEDGPSPGLGPGPKPGPGTGPRSGPEDEQKSIIYSPKALNTAKALIIDLWHCPLNQSTNLDGSVQVCDVLMRRDNLVACRNNGIDGEIRLVLVRRVNPTTLPGSLRKPGYIVFRDAFSSSDEEAFYFLVRLKEHSQHQHFFDLVAGPEGVRDPHRYIALLGKWKRVENCPYHAYYSEINTHCYYFTNRRD